jgi:putative RecB family exonuclease
MRPYLSYSQLALYLECPLKYRFRYIDEIKTEGVSSALVFGKAIHQALAQFYRDIQDGKAFCLPQFLDGFEEAWVDECERADVVFRKEDSFEGLLNQGKGMLKVFARERMPTMGVIAVEVPFEFQLENPETGEEFPIPIKGVIDLIEEDENGTLWVVDHKTSNRAFSDHQIDADLQLMIYAAAVEQLDMVEGREKRYRFDVLTKTKKPKFLQYRLFKDDLDRRKLFRLVTEMWKAIEAEAFYPRYSTHYAGCAWEDECREW